MSSITILRMDELNMNKIYERQSYIKEYETIVTECVKEQGKIYVKLEDSIFFPEEGGQYSDTGVIEYSGMQVHVIKGEIIDNQDVRYQVSDEIQVGTLVLCKLDWDQRYKRMQNHSGEHILSGLIHKQYGYNNVGFHLSDDSFVTLDLDGMLTQEQARELEKEANKVIYSNVPITDTYPSKEELVDIKYRSKIEIEGQTRLITIGDEHNIIDICACCAPHVSRTGEIGILKIISVVKFKAGVQISILCGSRALDYVNHNLDILSDMARQLSTHADNVPQILDNYKNEAICLGNQLSDLKEKFVLEKIEKMLDNDIPCVFSELELSAANMKNIYNALTKRFEGFVGLFVGNEADGYRFYAGSGTKDSRELAKAMKEKMGAKGGGSAEMIQGRLNCSKDSLLEYWKTLN